MKLEKERYGYTEEYFKPQRKQMKNLKFIINVYLLISTYLIIFAAISLAWAKHI